MRVLNIASNDYANMSHNNANALRHVGVDCDDYILMPHPFNYTSQSRLVNKRFVKEIHERYDIIQLFHSDSSLLDLMPRAHKIIVYHTGSRYRNDPEKYNAIFNPVVYKTITDHCEFVGLGAKDISYLAPHVDLLPANKIESKRIIVGHFPSCPETKGTPEIVDALKKYVKTVDFVVDTRRLSHAENLKRIAACDVYIELFKPEINGKTYGHFGVTAFEATALGCLVVTQNSCPNVFVEAYGKHPFVLANHIDELESMLDLIFSNNINELKQVYHNDFHNRFSIRQTGKRILNLIK